jgi:hypothetical protein
MQELLDEPSALPIADLVLDWQAPSELQDGGIKEGKPGLEADRHGRAIHLSQHIRRRDDGQGFVVHLG